MRGSARPRVRALGALATLGAILCWTGTGHATLTKVTSSLELRTQAALTGCNPGDFAIEDFEGRLGEDVPEVFLGGGFPVPTFHFPDTGIEFVGPDPNFNELAVIELPESVDYSLGANGLITSTSVLPSGVAFAGTIANNAECISFFLPPNNNSACSAVGMHLSAEDGAPVTLTVFDANGQAIGATPFDTRALPEEVLEGFIGVVSSGATIRSIQIRSSAGFAFDDIWHPKAINPAFEYTDVTLPTMCPEPSSTALASSAIVALAILAARRRRRR